MAEKATILIPDISGFTEFTSATELDHSAHITNELLDLIVASNNQGFTLAEIEGDAVLFYRTGDPPPWHLLVEQCLHIYRNFHERLKVIERDTVCQCGACQTATNLTLKFILHFGDIKEIRVAHFTKATGIAMIVAHRLLKNHLDLREYILVSVDCLNCFPGRETGDLDWISARESYPVIGPVEFAYADLADVRGQVPEPPEREEVVIARGDDNLEIEIIAPLLQVYQHLINVDERKNWMLGAEKIDRDPVTERIGMRHNCVFQGLTLENTCLYSEFGDDRARYVERVVIPELGVEARDLYVLTALEGGTLLEFNIDWQATSLPREVRAEMLDGIRANLEVFKLFCEERSTSVAASAHSTRQG